MSYSISEYYKHDLWKEYGSSHILARIDSVTFIHYAGDVTSQSFSWQCFIGNSDILYYKKQKWPWQIWLWVDLFIANKKMLLFVLLTTLYRTNDINYHCVIKVVSNLRKVGDLTLSYSHCVIKYVSELRQVGGITLSYFCVIKFIRDLRQAAGITLSYYCISFKFQII